ncbi:MAG: transporter [Modestobacter sp.]|jgi:MFS family permease|nr:transporter [Modestobacter sp.]
MASSAGSAATVTGRPAWLPVAAAMFCCGWGGNQFTPLLVMYRDAGYSVLVVDVLLGAYVVGLIPGLLTLGRLSDRVGRKPVLIGGTVLSLVASGSTALGEAGAVWIAIGRFVTGVGLAAAMAVGSTWVQELTEREPASPAGLGPRRSALCLTLGLGIGPGVAGVLAQWGPWPMVLPFLVHMALCVGALVVVRRSPETRPVRDARTRSRTHALRPAGRLGSLGHPRFVRIIVPLAPWVFGSVGVAYAIMPQVVEGRLGSWGLAYSTSLTVCTLGAGVAIQPIAKRLDRQDSARAAVTAMTILCLGLALSTWTAAVRSPWLALGAALVLGSGYGIAIVAGLLELQRLAPARELATMTGIFYALAYVGFLLPALLAALSAWASYVALLLGLTVIAVTGTAVVVRNSTRHLPRAPGGSDGGAEASPPARSRGARPVRSDVTSTSPSSSSGQPGGAVERGLPDPPRGSTPSRSPRFS